MAVQMRGYYGIGSAKKDFGFSSNMTLPLSGGYSCSSQPGGMPQEGHSGKGHASFAIEKEGRLGDRKKSKSWKSKLSSFFKKDKRKEIETVETSPTKGKVEGRPKESSPPGKAANDKATAPEDDVNAQILAQEGLATAIDEEELPHGELDESPLDDEDDMVVAQEVDVVYFDKESGNEDIPQASLSDIQEGEEELVEVESDRATYPIIPSEKQDSDQDDINNQNAESKSTEKMSSKHKKKKKTGFRRSTALEVNSQVQEEEGTGKKNEKTKKQRPKSMPAAPLALTDERQLHKDEPAMVSDKIVKPKSKAKQHTENMSSPSAPSEVSQKAKSKDQPKMTSIKTTDTGIQEAAALNKTRPEIKKPKEKKMKEKNVVTANENEAKGNTESPPSKKKNTKVKKKPTASEETFDSPILSASPPPEEEIRISNQVTVGVIKRKKSRTRPLLEVNEGARSEAYRSDPDGQTQGEDNIIDAEERELLHDMDTLQLMAVEGVAQAGGKKVKKKKQDKAQDTRDQKGPADTKVSPKAAKKSKQTKSKVKTVVESEPAVSQSHTSAESREPNLKVSKNKDKVKQQPEAVAQQPPQLEMATELDKKPARKVKKTKSKGKSELEAEIVMQAPSQPEALTESEKKPSKRVKKAKSREKIEVESEPVAQSPSKPEEATKVVKKGSKKAKKVGNDRISEPIPEPEMQPLPQSMPKDVPEDKKKKTSRMVKGKGKMEDTDTELQTPAKAAEEDNQEDVKPKRTKKKISVASSDSPSLHQNSPASRGSKSKLVTKAKVASEESDDLIWIGADKLSRKKKSSIASKDDTAVGEEPEDMNLSSNSRSTSYHELSKEDRKTFQEELRKASNQHSVDSFGAEGNIKVEIDPNVKVTKSGVVKGGKGSRRPSLQDFGGRYEQTDSASQSEDQGSGDRSRKISLDLSAVPQMPPSLGLAHGHDKLELVDRSSSKRRPMSNRESLLLAQGQEASTSTDSHSHNIVLAAQINNLQKSSTPKHRDSPSQVHVYQAALAKSKPEDSGQGTPTSVARQLFPSADGERSGEGSATSTLERSRRRKTVDQPVKTLGIASENTSPASSSVPAWVAMAKNKQMRSSLLLVEKEESKKSTMIVSSPPVPVPTTTVSSYGGRKSTDSTIPKMGTVQARLAAFERK